MRPSPDRWAAAALHSLPVAGAVAWTCYAIGAVWIVGGRWDWVYTAVVAPPWLHVAAASWLARRDGGGLDAAARAHLRVAAVEAIAFGLFVFLVRP